jgi:gluconolactonase
LLKNLIVGASRSVAVIATSAVCIGLGLVRAQTPGGDFLVRLDPGFDAVVPASARVEPVKVDYFGLVGKPVWIREGQGGYLLVGDSAANVVYKLSSEGTLTPFLDRAGYSGRNIATIGARVNNDRLNVFHVGPTGLALDREGRLIVAATGDRTLFRVEQDGTRTVVAERFDGKRLNSPIESVVKSNGAIYFTDGTAGLRNRNDDPTKELPFEGVYLVKDGRVQLLDKELHGINPGGIALSPDEKVLYVAGGRKVLRYDIRPDDTIANGRVFVDMTGPQASPVPRVGVKTDQKGNLYSSGPGGVWVLSPGGTHLGTIRTPEPAASHAFGDPDGKTLYIATRRSLYRVRVNIPG